jgi:tetratricopeptide (TPR) repeat protein
MEIRKEQVLALLTIGIGALIVRSLLQDPPRVAGFNPGKLEYEATAVPPTVLAGDRQRQPVRRDFCTEPSETRPLPPRELDFPPHPPLSVAAPPLPVGPDYGRMYMLRIDGAVAEGVTLQVAEAPAAAAAAATPPEGTEGQAPADDQGPEAAAKIYDRIFVEGQRSPFFGTIEPEAGVDPFDLEARTDFEGVKVRMRRYNLKDRRVGAIETFGNEGGLKIAKIALANTLRNEVQRKIRAVPNHVSHLNERRALIDWLLEKARSADWIYDTALEQAELFTQLSGGDIEGLRLQQRVLRERGDRAGEWALLQGLPPAHRESAFRYEGEGTLKAMLQLDAEAEADLRRAVELEPTNARPLMALAAFLRERGRSREAQATALRIEQTFGSLLGLDERVRAVRVLVACHLAMGDVESARKAAQRIPTEQLPPYLAGCIEYAAGRVDEALAGFRQAAATEDSSAALLGQGACLVRKAQWQEAHDALLRAYDEAPLLRHRSATTLALLFLRIGQFDSALTWLDRALEAAPHDPYAFYLRGRTLRLQDQVAPSIEALTAALRARDDFVHAIAEMAAVQSTRASETRGEDQAQAAIAARRYADRAVGDECL